MIYFVIQTMEKPTLFEKIGMNKVVLTIVRETFNVMILSNIISMIGGIALHSVQEKLIFLLPILILVPAVSAMIGAFAAIICSKFTTLLYLGEFKEHRWWHSKNFKKLFAKIFFASFLSSIYLGILAYAIAFFKGFSFHLMLFIKILLLTTLSTLSLVTLLLFFAIALGFYVYDRKHDPDSYLIPITTSIADVGTMVLFSVLLHFFF